MTTPAERQAQAHFELEAFARLLWTCSQDGQRHPSAWDNFSEAQRNICRDQARRLIEAGVQPPEIERGDPPLTGQLEIER